MMVITVMISHKRIIPAFQEGVVLSSIQVCQAGRNKITIASRGGTSSKIIRAYLDVDDSSKTTRASRVLRDTISKIIKVSLVGAGAIINKITIASLVVDGTSSKIIRAYQVQPATTKTSVSQAPVGATWAT